MRTAIAIADVVVGIILIICAIDAINTGHRKWAMFLLPLGFLDFVLGIGLLARLYL